MTFEKHFTTSPTGDIYEKTDGTKYYRIYETENGRYIDPDKYVSFLEFTGTLAEIDSDPAERTDNEKWINIRAQRNYLLTQSDWTVLPDSPLSPDAISSWKAYRQALRDIPSLYTNPDIIIWPDIPY